MDVDVTDDESSRTLPPPRKKPGRKPVGKRNLAKRPKERGKYKGKHSDVIHSEVDSDLADCLFSDDDIRDEFLQLNTAEDSESVLSLESSDAGSAASSSINESELSSSLNISRPSPVSFSRPSSVCSSRPSSVNSSRPSSVCSSRPSSVLSRPSSAIEPIPPFEESMQAHDTPIVEQENDNNPESDSQCDASLEIVQLGLTKFRSILPSPWVPIADREGFHLLLVSVKVPKAIQREIFISYYGNVQVLMHCKQVPSFKEIFELDQSRYIFNKDNIDKYCNFGLSLVKKFLQFDVCIGANELGNKELWNKIQGAEVDFNPYQEEKYQETCRSLLCLRIIPYRKGKKCAECRKISKSIQNRKDFLLSPEADPSTANKYLTYEQAMKKIEMQHEAIRKKDKQIIYLKSRVEKIVASEGVNISEDLNETFTRILLSSDKLTDVQKMFMQEQWASFNKEDSRAHRWHPSMIRLALSIYMKGSGNYDAIRDLGVMRLPHSRTLFDYAHSIKAKDGINEGLVKLVSDRVEQFQEPFKYFHALLCDGMHVSQNLVFRVSDGELIGFSNMDEVDREVERLEKYIDGKEVISCTPQLATEVLAFMVKGLASDVKCVVASYPMKVLTKEMLYKRSWDVIRHLETAGIKILCFVCDGHPVNRAFFNMHQPITTDTRFGVVFDTLNFCAPDERPIFFISDVCHLIKTLRNSFYNSGHGKKKTRLLTLNGEVIVWKFIIDLYLEFNHNNFRKSYKLNSQNVFPNSYSRMKVKPAVQVLSNTVAVDLESQGWDGSKETIKFIRMCNKFFDCLNGAHSSQGKRQNKPDLMPYTVDNIEAELRHGRFKFLRDFVDYLADWKSQVQRLPLDDNKKQKMYLPVQTMVGVETSVRAIEAATTFFLDPEKCGGVFLNARVFSQDPLEQHFSIQRAGGGGSRGINVAQFQQKQVGTALQRGLGVKKRRANSTEGEVGLKLTTEPVPKKKRSTKKRKE